MTNYRNALSPENLHLLATVASEGSLAAAARQLGLVPSALTYRLRQMEEQLDVLLVDRSSRRAQLTPAGSRTQRCKRPLTDRTGVSGPARQARGHRLGGAIGHRGRRCDQ